MEPYIKDLFCPTVLSETNNIKVISVGYPKEYNYGTDWMNIRVEFCDEWRQKMLSNIGKIANDDTRSMRRLITGRYQDTSF